MWVPVASPIWVVTINHIFNNGDLSIEIRKTFPNIGGVKYDHRCVKQLIDQQLTMKHKNEAHKLILQDTPILICWNRWKNLCASKYGAKTSNGNTIRYAIYNDNCKLITFLFSQVNQSPSWCGIIYLVERCINNTKVQKITLTIPL